MSLPSATKTWQYNVNQAVGSGATSLAANRNVMRTLVTSMLGFALSPWVVDYSCDGTTAGTKGDAVNRWSSDSALLWSTSPASAHSWIVLKQPGLSNAEILFDLGSSNSNGTNIRVLVSPSVGFTGGATTASPTASDSFSAGQQTTNDFAWNDIGDWTAGTGKMHVFQSTDGQCTRAVLCNAGFVEWVMVLDKPVNPTAGWSNPLVFGWFTANATNAEQCTYTSVFRNTNVKYRVNASIGGTGWASLYPTTEAVNGSEIGSSQNFANDVDGAYPITPIGLHCLSGVGQRGRQGALFDLWAGSTAVASGSTYPNDTSRQFAQLGILVFPWGGNANPQLA